MWRVNEKKNFVHGHDLYRNRQRNKGIIPVKKQTLVEAARVDSCLNPSIWEAGAEGLLQTEA